MVFKKIGSTLNFLNKDSNDDQYAKLSEMQRFVPGSIKILGWDLDYVDGPALASCIDVLVNKRWNDFNTDKENPVILDCGANVGISVLNYKRQFPGALITAFEPDPNIFKVLRSNLAKNGASDVKVVEAAVWTHNGEISFFCEGADGSRIVSGENRLGKETVVRTVDFTDFITGPVDLIKMDIEGAEFDVIPHIADKLRMVSNIVIECHIDNKKIGCFARILQVLASVGFSVSINSYGAWRDLVHNPAKLPVEFDQYLLLAAWREA